MSVRALNWVRTVQTGDVGTKSVLRVLADYADSDDSCWPSQALLAAETEQSARTVRRQIEKLVNDGLVKVVEQGWKPGGGRRPNRYVLQIDASGSGRETPPTNADNLSTLQAGAMRTLTTGNVDTDDRQWGQALSQESSLESTEESGRAPTGVGRASKIVSEWFDRTSPRPTRRVLAEIRTEVQDLLDADYQPAAIASALDHWADRGTSPRSLPGFARDAARVQATESSYRPGWAYNG